jgi:hypothetical protein
MTFASSLTMVIAVLLASAPAAAQTPEPAASPAVEGELVVEYFDAGELGAVSVRPAVSYWLSPTAALELGGGWTRWDVENADASNAWVRAGVRGRWQAAAMVIEASLGAVMDPENDDFNPHATLFAVDLDLKISNWFSPMVYSFAGITDTGVGALFGYLPFGIIASDPGHGGTLYFVDNGDPGADDQQLLLLDVSVGVGVQPAPNARIELALPLFTFDAAKDGADDRDHVTALFEDYLGVDVSGWVAFGQVELGARINYIDPDGDGTSLKRFGLELRAHL